jgi:hypothetical protein
MVPAKHAFSKVGKVGERAVQEGDYKMVQCYRTQLLRIISKELL